VPDPLRVLYSFPHKIGADRICTTAWYQVDGVSAAGARVLAYPGAVSRPLRAGVEVEPTLARGRVRIPYRAVGRLRALRLHDWIVAQRLPSVVNEVDVVHTWPLGAQHTLRAAQRLGIPTVLERPNAHTRFAYQVVEDECRRLNVTLPARHEHAFQEDVLAREETEYELADYLLCPSDFVLRTFLDQGFPEEKLLRHMYGFDPVIFFPARSERPTRTGLTVLFVGVAAVRKGLHFALEAWLRSSASESGRLLIAGEFLPSYRDRLAPMLAHPTVQVLGHRNDVPELMRASDLMILPSIEEGSALACVEAIGSGCVPLVSDICTGLCRNGENALVHSVGDVATLAHHLTLLNERPSELERLRNGALESAPSATWEAAGRALVDAYRRAVAAGPQRHRIGTRVSPEFYNPENNSRSRDQEAAVDE
jgi:D-inositol-3-phosphate glycosyltransferase